MHNKTSGSIVLSALVIGVIMVIGYIVISQVLESKEAQQIKNTTEETVERVNDVREQINTTTQAATEVIENTNEIINQVSP